MKQFKVNKITDAIDDLSVKIQKEAMMENEQMEAAAVEISMFNSGCDLVLSHIERRIVELESENEPVADKYEKLLRLIVKMRATVSRRTAPKAEDPSIMVPDQQIIIAS
jgi:hypothetical protein